MYSKKVPWLLQSRDFFGGEASLGIGTSFNTDFRGSFYRIIWKLNQL